MTEKIYAPRNIDGVSKSAYKKTKMRDGIQCCQGLNTSTRNVVHKILCVEPLVRARVNKLIKLTLCYVFLYPKSLQLLTTSALFKCALHQKQIS